MELTTGILITLSGAGIFQGLFISFYLLTQRRNNRLGTVLFSLLLLVLTARVTKSVAFYFFDPGSLLINLGFISHVASAPITYLYLSHSIGKRKSLGFEGLIHLAIPFLIFLISFFINGNLFDLEGWYDLSFIYTAMYHVISVSILIRSFRSRITDRDELVWLGFVWATVFLLWVAYFSNFILGLTPYIIGPLFFSLSIYVLSFMCFKYYQKIFNLKFQPDFNAKEKARYIMCLEEILHGKKLFKDPELTMTELARQISIPPYRLSRLINDHFKQNFSDFINTYRVKEAQQRLVESNNETIASIAFECGFNALSAFNHAFKKIIGSTPSEFRRHNRILR